MKNKPSEAQFEVLARAMMSDWAGIEKPIGRLLQGYGNSASVTTIQAMLDRGWIERGKYIRDAIERSVIQGRIEARIELARNALIETGDEPVKWHSSMKHLMAANDLDGLLNRQAYWVTESGRKILSEMQTMQAETS